MSGWLNGTSAFHSGSDPGVLGLSTVSSHTESLLLLLFMSLPLYLSLMSKLGD